MRLDLVHHLGKAEPEARYTLRAFKRSYSKSLIPLLMDYISFSVIAPAIVIAGLAAIFGVDQ